MAAPPMRLMNLDDDTFSFIAELSWDGSPAGGLLGTCRRAQTVGTAALRSVCLSMGKRGGRRSMLEDAHTAVPLTSDVRAPLTAWVPVVLRFLNRATGLSTVILDEDAEPFPFAERAAVWERIGEGLRGHPLRVLEVTGSALAVLASRGATARSLRELGLFSWPLEREAPIEAALAAVAPFLDMLLGYGGACFYDPDVLVAAGGMPRLRALVLFWFFPSTEDAAGLATACPLLETLVLEGCVEDGVGHEWSRASGRLLHLKCFEWEHTFNAMDMDMYPEQCSWVQELGEILAGRTLQSLNLFEMTNQPRDVGVSLADSLLSAATLPASLHIHGACLSGADARRLVADPRTVYDLDALSLPPLSLPPSWMAELGQFPRLHSLSLTLELCDVTSEALAPAPWVGLPSLELLTVQLMWRVGLRGNEVGDVNEAAPPLPTVGWVAGSVAVSHCRVTLKELRLKGHFFSVLPEGVCAFAPLARVPRLRSLALDLRPPHTATNRHLANGSRTTLAEKAALRALLPGVSVQVLE